MFHPTTFGKYFLTRRIAVGGMAEVFAAKLYGSDGFEKDLVIKQILPQYARDPEFVQSFVTEAKIAVSLSHANVVGIYELGRVDGTYFIAMELVDGLDAFSLIQEAKSAGVRIDIGSALLITEEVAKGLDYAHRKVGPDGLPLGLVHRDLNPRNVLVSREGDIKILDFGIAKTASSVTAMPKTRAGVVKGTTGYMSPEQAVGGAVDARTDVYQAGLLLWELLTHQALFWRPDDGETRDRMRRHQIPAPSSLARGVPRELDEVVLAALTRSPEERIQTAAELARRVGVIRYTGYPHANPVDIGALVTRLADRQKDSDDRAAETLPSTMDLNEAISDALLSSGAQRMETIARAPSDIVRPKSPLASPPASVARPATEPVASSKVAAIASAPDAPPVAVDTSGRNTKSVALALVLALGMAAVAGLTFLLVDVPGEPESVAAADPVSVLDTPPPQATKAVVLTATKTETAEPPPVTTSPRIPTKRIRRPPPPKAELASISFGTRSCSSRVSLDGQIVARSTPSFDHRVAAGMHDVVIEGTSCPPIERPGSLRRSIPTVAMRIQVEPGAKLKVIADYEREQLIVRPQ